MNNFCLYLTVDEYIAKCKQSGTPHQPRKKLVKQSRDNLTCSVCGMENAWKLAGTGLCFSCTTGESDASCDYELKEAQ